MTQPLMANQLILSKLTLVIPTYQRQEYALRNMRYWSGRGVQLLVLDGSPVPLKADALTGLSDTIEYIHATTSMVERLRQALALVKTPYAALLGDDEFFLSSGLLASIQALEADPELVACMGQPIGFSISNLQEVNGFDVYPKHIGYEVGADRPGKRMYDHMRDYACSTIYAVVRTDTWKRAFTIYVTKELPVYAIGELQFELAVSYFGKSKIIPVLHWLRSFEIGSVVEENTENNPSLNKKNIFHEWWFAPDKSEFRKEFLRDTSVALAQSDGRDVRAVSKEIEIAMDAYSNLCLSLSQKTFRQNLRTHLRSNLPSGMIKAVRKFLRVYRIFTGRNPTSKYEIPLQLAAQQMVDQGVQVDCDELSEVVDIIKNFHVNSTES